MKKIKDMFVQGDCVEEMKKIEDNTVDLIIADPPYWKVVNEKWDYKWKTESDEMEQELNELVCPRNVAPDITLLKDSVEQAKKSVLKRTKGYTTIVTRQKFGANDEKNT